MKTKKKTQASWPVLVISALVIIVVVLTAMLWFRPDEQKYLVVMNAASASASDSTLTLRGVEPDSLFFSDRPERDTQYGTTKQVAALWQSDDFNDDPPNAAVTWRDGDATFTLVVELTNPQLRGDELSFDYKPLSDEEGLFEANMENVSVFVDAFPTSVNSQITD